MSSNRAVFPRVAMDTFMMQGTWTIYFLGFIILSQLVQNFFAMSGDHSTTSFFISSHTSSRIYMLIIGIIGAIYILPYYVQQGVTRRDYFKGAALGSLYLAIALTLATFLIAGVEYLIIRGLNIPLVLEFIGDFDLEVDDPVFMVNLFYGIIVPSPVEGSTLSALGITLSILGKYFYYIIGWMIGSAFFRYNVLVGLFSILLSIVLTISYSALWGLPIGGLLPVKAQLVSLSLPMMASWLGSTLIIGFILWCIRQFTKRAPIKP